MKLAALESLGVLRARGADVIAFLQGQLSNDLTRLGEHTSLLAGYHNPQGRTIALLRLIRLAPDDLVAILPRELVAPVAARLGKFVLRARVKLSDESAQWAVYGLSADGAPGPQVSGVPAAVNAVERHGEATVVRVGDAPLRALLVQPRAAQSPFAQAAATDEHPWRALSIAAAEPQVYGATSEEFVAQMLNLDALGAIAFDKGCYTGQEVIARAHYRGRVKRRLQRFLSSAPARLSAGDSCTLSDGRTVKVVDALVHADGRCEFLGVTAVAAGEEESGTAAASAAPAQAVIEATLQPMPYALPA